MRWLALHFPQLQLDSVYVNKEILQDTRNESESPSGALTSASAVIVLDEKQCVCQLNEVASREGIQFGMKLGTASALVDQVQFFSHSPDFERQRLIEIAQACYQVSADIVIWDSKTLIFDVEPMLQLYGSFECYVNALLETEALHDVCVSTVIAATPLAAYLLSSSACVDEPLVSQFSRKDEWLSLLDSLGLDSIGIALEQQLQLRRLGLHRLSDLRELFETEHSRRELGNRMGKKLLSHIAQLFGDESVALTYFKPKGVFARSVLLEHEIYSTTALLFPLKNLLQGLQRYLQRRSRRIQTLSIHFQQRDGATLSFDLASAEPERESARWLNLVQLKLESIKLPAPVVAVKLEASKLLEEQVQSNDLFEAKPALSTGQVIARIQAKLGDESVKQMCLEADHRPEYSFRYRRVGALEPAAAHELNCVFEQEQLKKSKHLQTLRPSLILPSPIPLEESLRFIHGPERIQSAWWTESPVCRDYFVARNMAQQTLWVFRDQRQQWFVHGLFA